MENVLTHCIRPSSALHHDPLSLVLAFWQDVCLQDDDKEIMLQHAYRALLIFIT